MRLSYGLRSYFGNVTELAVWRLDQMMLTVMALSTTVGLYAVAVAISEITAIFGIFCIGCPDAGSGGF